MLLAIDIGNTNIVSGVYRDETLIAMFRIGTDKTKTQDEYGMTFHMCLAMNEITPKEITDIDIRVHFLHKHRQAAVFQKAPEARAADPFSDTGNHPACHKNILGHLLLRFQKK